MTYKDWRQDIGINQETFYKRRFAFLPVNCQNDKIWLKYYYSKYISYSGHVDFIENINEAEYIVRKLAENF